MTFNVVIDPPETALQSRGFTTAAMQAEVEQAMMKGGVPVDKNGL